MRLSHNVWASSATRNFRLLSGCPRTETTYTATPHTRDVDGATSTTTNVRPFTDIPLVKGKPLIGSSLEVLSNMRELHKLLDRRIREYGPVYREQLGIGEQAQMVFTANPDDWKNILYGEVRGTPAGRMKLWSLDAYSRARDTVGNYFNLEGKDYEHAKEGIKPLLMPKNVAKLVPDLCVVTDDLMDRFAEERDGSNTIHDVRELIHKWTFECGGWIVYQTRFGLVKKNPEDAQFTADMFKFYNHARDFFSLICELETGMPHHRTKLTPTWFKFVRTFDEIKEYCTKLYHSHGEHIVNPDVDYTHAQRVAHAQSVVLASADTTAHSATWILVELSYNPELQEKLYEEITQKTKDGGDVNLQIPYLRGFLREMFRVRPLTALNNKILAEDLVVSGYHVPAGCTVNMLTHNYNQHDWFSDADEIRPERWFRGAEGEAVHPFTVLPFGHGQRSCMGRRIAENELLIFISKLVKRFRVSFVKPRDEIDSKFTLMVVPNSEVAIKFEER